MNRCLLSYLANKFEEAPMKENKVPVSAFNFKDVGAEVGFREDEGEGKSFILGYSGKVIKGHWYWGDLAIDVNGADFPKKVYPILDSHYTDRRIGFTAKPDTSKNNLMFDNVKFVSTPAADEFRKLSKEGFPFEASISGRPLIVERLEEGTSAEVNGFTLKGPASIWRKWTFKEVSVCVFGADSQTKSKAFSDSEQEAVSFIEPTATSKESAEGQISTEEVNEVMFKNLAEFKEKAPELYEAFTQEVKASLENQFKAEKEKMETAVTSLRADLDKASERILSFEKSEVLRKEKDRESVIDRIWREKFAESEIPEHLFGKVKAMVPASKFIKDGELDETGFTAAIVAEIADWVKMGVKKSSIEGFGSTGKEASEAANQQKADETWVKEMRQLAGQSA
jgi:hypothetical protein